MKLSIPQRRLLAESQLSPEECNQLAQDFLAAAREATEKGDHLKAVDYAEKALAYLRYADKADVSY